MTDKIPGPSPDFEKEEPWEDDALAQFESQRDPLEAQLQAQDKRNRLDFKKTSGVIVILATWVAAALLIAAVVIWAWHYLTPWPFLSASQLDKVQSILFSGTLGAVVTALARNYVGK